MRFYIFFFSLFFTTNAHAYIDPGNIAVILNAIIGAIASVFVFFSSSFNKIKSKIKNFLNKSKKN